MRYLCKFSKRGKIRAENIKKLASIEEKHYNIQAMLCEYGENKMKAKKIIALLLAATLSMTAFTGCSINKEATVATLNDEDIKLGIVNFMIRFQEAAVDDIYMQYMGEEYWNKSMTGTDTVLETWKENAIEQAHELYTLKAHMSDYDVEITDEEKENIEKAAATFIDDNSNEALSEMGATKEIVEEYLELSLIKTKMYEAIVKNADSDVSDEEANMSAYTIVKLDYSGYYDSNYQFVSYTEEEAAQIKEQAESVLTAVGEGDTLEDAAAAVSATATTGTYATYVDSNTSENDEGDSADDSVYTTNNLEQAVVEALNTLSEGACSELIETESSYYIVRLDKRTDEEATKTNKETVQGNKEDKYYNSIISGWQDDETWSVEQKQLDKIKIHNYFTTTTESTENTEAVDETEN